MVAGITIVTYVDALLDGVVTFWNREFRGKRNFFPITPELFGRRVILKANALERFDPSGLHIAVDKSGDVAGLLHTGRNSEEFCKACLPGWTGGTRGYVALLAVAEKLRRCGIADALWRKGMDHLKGTKEVAVDGQCLNPFYGNSEGPFTPFWGTTEGISVEWDNDAVRSFLARRGHLPRYKGVTLELALAASSAAPARTRPGGAERASLDSCAAEQQSQGPLRPNQETTVPVPERADGTVEPPCSPTSRRQDDFPPFAKGGEGGFSSDETADRATGTGSCAVRSASGGTEIESAGFRFLWLQDAYPVVGEPLEQCLPNPAGLSYTCHTALHGERVAGHICVYPMSEVAEGKHAIYELSVAEKYYGRGLGRALLDGAVAQLRAANARNLEVVTLPDLSPAALALYVSAGFRPVAEWAVY